MLCEQCATSEPDCQGIAGYKLFCGHMLNLNKQQCLIAAMACALPVQGAVDELTSTLQDEKRARLLLEQQLKQLQDQVGGGQWCVIVLNHPSNAQQHMWGEEKPVPTCGPHAGLRCQGLSAVPLCSTP